MRREITLEDVRFGCLSQHKKLEFKKTATQNTETFVWYLKADVITHVKTTERPKSKLQADGYGCTGTETMIKITGSSAWRRVYALCYGNGGLIAIKQNRLLVVVSQDQIDQIKS